MATFWERAAHLVNRLFSLLCLFAALVVPILVSRAGASVPGHHCLPFTFYRRQHILIKKPISNLPI